MEWDSETALNELRLGVYTGRFLIYEIWHPFQQKYSIAFFFLNVVRMIHFSIVRCSIRIAVRMIRPCTQRLDWEVLSLAVGILFLQKNGNHIKINWHDIAREISKSIPAVIESTRWKNFDICSLWQATHSLWQATHFCCTS
ncbi:hypothetical protein ACJX0J_027977 [Zea mays]